MALIQLPATTHVLACSDCESGTYVPVAGRYACDECDNAITRADVDLDPGEVLAYVTIAPGEVRVAYSTAPDLCPTCGTGNAHHWSVRLGTDLPAVLIDCPEGS